ncbi:MAG: hypothetical protein P0Y65_20690 [Candidatus Devosia phytovorans]|uniref:Uncharacterized protein n=1 Tax=Candidatus Devosia phytovorans TaxID=3121372 RepID=A0AAJ5VVA6_9HYPH|nr:hypothetical protein [Devosia sp.]WEK04560.1 MAG: hypothetical protein P0Y65_20690 [Devosia sp.]
MRISAVEALKGRTLVGSNVLDTPNGALDVQADGSLRTDEERPFISVFTDASEGDDTERGMYGGALTDIVFEMGISMPMVETDQETGISTVVGINIPASDGAFEFFLDIVQRQIVNALSDPDNAWAEIYRDLFTNVVKTKYVGARNSEDGQRLAGHQLRLTVDLCGDPSGSAIEPGSALARFLETLDGSDDAVHADMAEAMRATIDGSALEWETIQRKLGLTRGQVDALGLGPLNDDAGEMSDISIEVEGRQP